MKKIVISLVCASMMTSLCSQSLKITSVLNTKISHGLAEGALQVTVKGGTPDYTYKLLGPTPLTLPATADTTVTLNNLQGGFYTVNVSDAAGNTDSKQFVVNFFKSPGANRLKLAYCKRT